MTPFRDPAGDWWDWPVGLVLTVAMFLLVRWAVLTWV